MIVIKIPTTPIADNDSFSNIHAKQSAAAGAKVVNTLPNLAPKIEYASKAK